jgi:hypothetical protein
LTFQGRWAWWLKDWIDRAFMNKYGRDLVRELQADANNSSSSSSSSTHPS